MKTVKFKMHSMVDVITNSSTVIYTYQDGCLNPAKELINEVLKLEGSDKNADDLFEFEVSSEGHNDYKSDPIRFR